MKLLIVEDESLTVQELKNLLHHTDYKSFFLVSKSNKLIPIDISEVAFFYIKNELIMLYTNKGESYLTNYSLNKLEVEINPHDFYRANRQFLINRHIVKEVERYFARKLSIKCHIAVPERIIVSKAKSSDFKKWLECRRSV